jgi:threonine aldolase
VTSADSTEDVASVVDLRSDTVTRPGPAMRRAIAEAEVGDDLLGDDPTVKRLEARVAEILGKEASLFFPSGLMANQTALATQGAWGSEVVVEAGAHVLHWEEGAAAAMSGLQLRPVEGRDGALDPEAVAAAIRPDSRYMPRTSLVCLENTHLASGGTVLSPEATDAVAEVAHDRGLSVHLDGARLWHAPTATGRPITDFTRSVDTVMVCLSKGLGAPVGSMLAGPAEVMERAWRVRRRFGGAMRQSGILAAAGLYALEHHRERLAEDHENARSLAAALDRIPGIRAPEPATNVVLASSAADGPDLRNLLNYLGKHGILMLPFGERRIRAVTHHDVDTASIGRTAGILAGWTPA